MIEKTTNFILRFHKPLMVGVLVLTAILFYWFTRIEIATGMSGLTPARGHAERDYLDRTNEDLGSDYFMLIVLNHDQIFSSSTLTKIDRLSSEIAKHPMVDDVLSLSTANVIKGRDNEIYLQNIAGNIPMTDEMIAQFRSDILSNPLYAGNLISNNERATLITVFLDYVNHSNKALIEATNDIEALAMAAAGPEEIYTHGPPILSRTEYKMLSADLRIYVPLMILIAAVITCITLRCWQFVAISFVYIFMCIIWTYGTMGLAEDSLSLLTSIIPPILAALGISYAVHIFSEYLRQRGIESDPKVNVGRTMRNILLAVWLSIITTAVGFGSLSLVQVEGIIDFSIYLVVGMLSLWILATFFITVALIIFHPPGRTEPTKRPSTPAGKSNQIANFVVRRRHIILVVSALAVAPLAIGIKRLNIDTDVYKIFKPSAPIIQATHALAKDFHGATAISVVMEGNASGDIEDPAILKSIEKLQAFLDRLPYVSKSMSVVDYIKTINKAFHDDETSYYRLPDSKEEISQYLLVYSLADPERTLDRYKDYNHRIARISLRIGLTSSSSILEFKKLIEQKCSELFPPGFKWKVTNEPVLFAITSQLLGWGILISFSIAALVIFVIMVILFRSLKMGVIAMIPNLLPVLATLALMGWTGIDFNIGTSIIICVAIGIAVDDTIHFLTRYFNELKRTNHYLIRRYTDIKITGDQIRTIGVTFNRVQRPIILTSVVIFCGFMVLAFSQFVPIMFFGILTALTMVFCLLCDLILLPALLASVRI